MNKKELKRGLNARHIKMIALGGTIGVGLFMGAASTIRWTGPSVLLAYAISGFILYLVMRALGELIYVNPSTGSFANYAEEYIHPVAGYLTAWSNVFQYIVVGISEVIAIGQYVNYWWPTLSPVIPGIIVVLFLTCANLTSVKLFGELEFLFSSVKIIAIILMIIAGIGIIFFGVGNQGQAIGLSNLWLHGGFFTGGIKGFLFSLSIVVASYQGIELIGMAAGEAENPKQTIVAAIQSTISRILIFYIGSIFIIVTVYPWNQLETIGSPFVQLFSKIGITFASGLINFVVLTAALSGCNSGIFSASRMIFSLSVNEKLSKKFTKLTKKGVPLYAVIAISAGVFIGLLLNYILPIFLSDAENIFVLVYSSSVLPGMVPWVVILISHLKFRKKNKEFLINHPFKMPLSPYTNYLSLLFLLVVLIFMIINPETRFPLLVGAIFLICITIHYFGSVAKF